MRILVAKTDGQRDRSGQGLAPGSVQSGVRVPLTRDFDPRQPPMGMATIVVEGDDVYAEIPDNLLDIVGKYPALGGRSSVFDAHHLRQFDVLEVSICSHPNSDARIPPING